MSGARHSSGRDGFFLLLDALVQEGCLKWQRESQGSAFDREKPLRVDYFLREVLQGSSRVFWAKARDARANPDKEGIKTEWSFNVFCERLSPWVNKDHISDFDEYFREIYWPAELAWRERRKSDREFSARLEGMLGACDFSDMLLTHGGIYQFWLRSIYPFYVNNNYADAIGLSSALCRKSHKVMKDLGGRRQIRGGLNLVEVVARAEMMMFNCGDAAAGSLVEKLVDTNYCFAPNNWQAFYVFQKLAFVWGGLKPSIRRLNQGAWENDEPLIHLLTSLQGQLPSTRRRPGNGYPRWSRYDYAGDCSGVVEALVAREANAGIHLKTCKDAWTKIPNAVDEIEEFLVRPDGLIYPHWLRLNSELAPDPLVKSAAEIALARCSIQSETVQVGPAANWLMTAKSTLSGTNNHLAWSEFYFWCAKYMRTRGNSGAEVLALRNVSRLQTAAGNNEKAAASREDEIWRLRNPLIPAECSPNTDEDDLLTFLESDPPSLSGSNQQFAR